MAKSISLLGLSNVTLVEMAVGDTKDEDVQDAVDALKSGDFKALKNVCTTRSFSKAKDKPGYIEANIPGDRQKPEMSNCKFTTLPAKSLVGLRPTLLKLTAPGFETAILSELNDAELDVIVGETWRHIPTNLIYSGPGLRQTWLPKAGCAPQNLRRTLSPPDRAEGLDVTVAMYNANDWIVECVEKIIECPNDDIRALVIDDGSTDGCGDLVREHFAGNARVVLHTKLNGGCASARNFGRLMSNRSHIAFVDADDVPDAELFPQLLELSRYTGAEITQGGFDLLTKNENDEWSTSPTKETSLPEIVNANRFSFGDFEMYQLPSRFLAEGQPTIWRRVYRRDFLDNKNIWFPEHIRAFDDQIFQLLTLQYSGDVPCLDGVAMHYRQHSDQDIRWTRTLIII